MRVNLKQILICFFSLVVSIQATYTCGESTEVLNATITNVAVSSFDNVIALSNCISNDLRATIYYSMLPYPGSISYNCPSPRYKSILFNNTACMLFFNSTGSYTSYVENSTLLNLSFEYNSNFNHLTIGPVLQGRLLTSTTTYNDILNSIPNNCSFILPFSVQLRLNVTENFISPTFSGDLSPYLPCTTTDYSCGYYIYPKYDTSCCYIDGKSITKEFVKNSSLNFDENTLACVTSGTFFDPWTISVIVLAIVLFLVLLGIISALLCRSGAVYL